MIILGFDCRRVRDPVSISSSAELSGSGSAYDRVFLRRVAGPADGLLEAGRLGVAVVICVFSKFLLDRSLEEAV